MFGVFTLVLSLYTFLFPLSEAYYLSILPMSRSTIIRRPGCLGSETMQWLRLGCNTPSFRERFDHQIEILRKVVNVCREQLGYKPLENKLPESIVCKRECNSEVRVWLRPLPLAPFSFFLFLSSLLTHLITPVIVRLVDCR